MKLNDSIKLIYIPPTIQCIELDNQISLAMESLPPGGEGEDEEEAYFSSPKIQHYYLS